MSIIGFIKFAGPNNNKFLMKGFKDIFVNQKQGINLIVLSKDTNLKYTAYSNALVIGQETQIPLPNQELSITNFKRNNALGDCFLIHMENNVISIIRNWNCRYSIFYYMNNEAVYFSTDIRLLKNLIQISFDLVYLQNIIGGERFFGRTAFKKIFEVLPNCYLKFNFYTRSFSQEVFLSFYSNPAQYDYYIAKEEVYKNLKNVCRVQTKNFSNIILDYSGGLDSTLLLYILAELVKETGQKLIPVNFFASQFNLSNESQYCRFFCKQNNLSLVSLDHAKCLPFDELETFTLLPKHPSAELVLFKRFNTLTNLAKSLSNVCFVNGEGGDHVFSCPPILESLADVLIDKKFGLYFKKLKNLFYFFRIPLVNLLSFSIKGNLNIESDIYDKPHIPWLINYKIGDKKSNLFFDSIIHNLKLSPGKLMQLISIYYGNDTSNLDPRKNNFIENTVLFNPILEASFLHYMFNIPTYELFERSYDRFLVRDILSAKSTTNLVWRKDKGDIAGLVQWGFQKNIKTIMEICMEGIMIKNHLADKSKLENHLRRLTIGGEYEEYHYIMSLVGVELFIRSWQIHLNN